MDKLETKIKFIKAIEKAGVEFGTYKLIFKYKGLYGKPEAWVYSKNKSSLPCGILITEETIEDIDYLREYLRDLVN